MSAGRRARTLAGEMTTLILIAIFLIGLALVVYSIMLGSKLNCPHCVHTEEQGLLIPVVPPLVWLCLTCGQFFGLGDAQRTLRYRDEDDESDLY